MTNNSKRTLPLTWFFYRVKITTSTNGFLYFLRHLPLVGSAIPPTVYNLLGVKKFLAVIMAIWRLFWRALLGFGLFLLGFLASDNYFLHIVGIKPATVGLTTSTLLAATAWLTAFAFIRGFVLTDLSVDVPTLKVADQFSLSRQETVQATNLSNLIARTFFQGLLPLAYYAALTRNPWLLVNGVGLFLLPQLWREVLPRLAWQHKQRAWPAAIAFWLIMVAAPLGLALTGRWPLLLTILFSPAAAVIVWVLAGLAFFYWLTFKQEPALLTKTLMKQKTLGTADEVTQAQKQSAQYLSTGQAMQKKMTLDAPGIQRAGRLSGSNYLNALLFARYRRQLRRSLLIRVGIIALIGVAFLLVMFLFPSKVQVQANDLTPIYGALFFVMYLASFGRPIVQMLFVNCDAAMLYYPFYRQRRTILSGFFYRFWRTFLLNAGIGLLIFVIFLELLVVMPVAQMTTFYLVLALELLGLVLLFSFHELFVYYLLQPFTADMTVVSPLYRIIYGGMYWVAWSFTQFHLAGYGYAIAIGLIALAYVGIGTIAIYFRAPQTFRVRN